MHQAALGYSCTEGVSLSCVMCAVGSAVLYKETMMTLMGLLPAKVLCYAHSFWYVGPVPASLGAGFHLCLQGKGRLPKSA